MGITPEFPGASQIFGEGLISDYTGIDRKSSAMDASLAWGGPLVWVCRGGPGARFCRSSPGVSVWGTVSTVTGLDFRSTGARTEQFTCVFWSMDVSESSLENGATQTSQEVGKTGVSIYKYWPSARGQWPISPVLGQVQSLRLVFWPGFELIWVLDQACLLGLTGLACMEGYFE